jgi:hypothetical protein
MTSSEVRAIRELRSFSGEAYAAVGASALVADRQLQLPNRSFMLTDRTLAEGDLWFLDSCGLRLVNRS